MGTKVLYHVHMVPRNVPGAQQQWDQDWRRYGRRTSDRYLFYANSGSGRDYLLIDLVDDPGAHQVWDAAYAEYRKELEKTADDFVYFGKVK